MLRKTLISNMWHILHYVVLKVLKHPLSPNELYGLNQFYGRFSQELSFLAFVPCLDIWDLHFLCWFNSFEGYYHSDFLKFLSNFAVTFCVETMFAMVFYVSPFVHYLKHSVTSFKSGSFSLKKVLFVTFQWQSCEKWGEFCHLSVGKHVSSFHWWLTPADVHEINSTTYVKTCHT